MTRMEPSPTRQMKQLPAGTDLGRWITARKFPKSASQDKEVEQACFAPISGQTQYTERDSHDDALEIWQREPVRTSSLRRTRNKAPHPTKNETEERGFTFKEALEGKPKSKSIPKPSQPHRTIPDLGQYIETMEESSSEQNLRQSYLPMSPQRLG